MDSFAKIKSRLEAYGVDAVLVTSAPNRYFAAGFRSSDGVVLVAANDACLCTDSRYIEAAQTAVSGARVIQMDAQHSYTQLIREFIAANNIIRLGFEEDSMSWSQHKAYAGDLGVELVPVQGLFTELRASKQDWEIENMIAAQRISERAFDDILGIISTELTEREVAAELTYRMQKYGAEGNSFDPIVVSAEKSSLPHGVPGPVKIKPGFLTMDFGCVYNGYCSDMTRTVCVGQPTDEMRRVYDIVLEAQLAGIAAARAGIYGWEIDAAARRVIEAAGYGAYFGHGFGHSLGIEIHEKPNANASEKGIMPIGAVVSAEPGIYLPGRFGVRIEDVVVLGENGCTDITLAPKHLICL